MRPKRARKSSPALTGVAAGERLKRARLVGNDYTAWGWVGTEVTDVSAISREYRLATCGFARKSHHPFCPNKYSERARSTSVPRVTEKAAGELEDDVIVISDDESSCSLKQCKGNPNCLNYLGQDKWENERKALEAFLKLAKIGSNPHRLSRDPDTPVGLKNLGATCYANAFLQVWYQDLPFRSGVYQCTPAQDEKQRFQESPIFQLQVTFAAMQESTQSAFNPVKLVESLKLRATEQQDAQEFSKLFMAHLDSEFQKQSVPGLKSLLADQFQGKQAYGTICSNCQNRSEQECEFLEIEVNIQNNATLEDRISALLEPEELSGDNQYLCSVCDSLQDARRYIDFRQLPPVLHISLLRFVFDLSTMERKKSKHAIAYPLTLDMGRFLGNDHQINGTNGATTRSDTYQLRGVLLHKGASAYHGHYEAQIFDVKNQAWYQFNDETVTKIDSLGPKPKATNVEKGEVPSAKPTNGSTPRPKKKPRLQDSDKENVSGSSTPKSDDNRAPNNHITSKDAYMLIYARVPSTTPQADDFQMEVDPPASQASGNTPTVPIPPVRALNVVRTLNEEFDKACDVFSKREREAKARFEEKRRMVMDIYRNWNVTSSDIESVVVSKQALESWLGRYIQKPSDDTKDVTDHQKTSPKDSSADIVMETPDSSPSEGEVQVFSSSEIACIHGRLDPSKSGNMKRITKQAVQNIFLEDDAEFDPIFEPGDVCDSCVASSFIERLYQLDHPQEVARFEEVCTLGENEKGYWISKSWLRDWRLARPKMHEPGLPDPSPNSEEYREQVECEHDGLTINPGTRRRISVEGYNILREIFPNWQTLSTDVETCAICEAAMHTVREDKRGIRRQAEDEKAKLKHTFDNALVGTTQLLAHVPCAIVPSQFLRMWKQWLFRPTEIARPERVDTSQFICKHGLLSLDPNNPSDLDSTVCFIKESDWDVLETLYPCGRLISVENDGAEWVPRLPICDECRIQRRATFEYTELTIRLLRLGEPIPTTGMYSEESLNEEPRRMQPITYGSSKVGGLRQSKRIRYSKVQGRRKKITIHQQMSVKDLKAKISEDLGVSIICQRLFYRGAELEDNFATIKTLGIMANDLVDLREESEDVDLLSDTDDKPRKSKVDEGRGFGGTLLGGGGGGGVTSSEKVSERTPVQDRPTTPEPPKVISCPKCTFDNPLDALACEICDTLFIESNNA